jgi:hypothetical protein
VIDLPALKSSLSDPREVARLLGLRVLSRGHNAVRTPCPVHGGKGATLKIAHVAGVIALHCKSCGFGGDVLSLLTAIEGDFKRGLVRAQEMVGGAAGKAYEPEPTRERLPVEVYHELATRILEAGRLDGRRCVREVEEYLARRRLLELAQTDGWACLPGLGWLLKIAKEVCDGMSASGAELVGSEAREAASVALGVAANERGGRVLPGSGRGHSGGSFNDGGDSQLLRGPFKTQPRDLLIAADLARYNQRGEFIPTWGRWRLVIPWRAPDGRVNCLQRRRTWTHEGEGPESAKYVFPFWRPDWPYGADRLRIGQDRKEIGYGVSSGGDQQQGSHSTHNGFRAVYGEIRQAQTERLWGDCASSTNGSACAVSKSTLVSHGPTSKFRNSAVAIVEGAVDVLAMRALHPSFLALGVPGITSWREEWAGLAGDSWRVCLDRGKPRKSDGLVSEDIAAARIALSLAGRGQESAVVIEWWVSRWRRGRLLGCALCGAGESWLCRGCGRRFPRGKDWGEDWASAH